VREAIERSFGVLGIRMYGGHFFVAGGRLDFIGCLFYDMEILTPMTDRLRFGDDIFVRCVGFAFTVVDCVVLCVLSVVLGCVACRGGLDAPA
jgi:hypothetical protein